MSRETSVTTPTNDISKVFEMRDFSIVGLEPVLSTVDFDFIIRGLHWVWMGLYTKRIGLNSELNLKKIGSG